MPLLWFFRYGLIMCRSRRFMRILPRKRQGKVFFRPDTPFFVGPFVIES
ncbi:hypothetical protein SUBVAR_04538 [Subdoligranulum variabile DSM 15176]|uniref:Uncharacterized protein n=1 Tax=Subdoligranulum variabile DSM 15176 TaxID=411471 RepID=D1PKA7_9FIRM|nr:hypothetical protein SUBVAR_04538 [Subdoligranulum variabile DSM 15176]